MQQYIFEFAGLAPIFFLAVIMPGPDFAMTLRQSIGRGRQAGIFTGLGIAAAIFVHATYTILGVGLIISQSIIAFNIVKLLGAAYLLYLGIQTLRAPAPKAPSFAQGEADNGQSVLKSFGIGFLTNLLNPKATLFFVSIFTNLVSVTTPAQIQFTYVTIMSATLFIWFTLVSIFFTTPKVRETFYATGKWFNRITGIALIFLAARIALTQHSD